MNGRPNLRAMPLAVLLVMGCGSSDPVADGGAQADLGLQLDGGLDAGGPADAGVDAGQEMDGGSVEVGPVVQTCLDEGVAAASACMGAPTSSCRLQAARARCTEDRADVLTFAFRCLTLMGTGPCPSFDESGSALDCLRLTQDNFDLDAALDLNVVIAAACPDSSHPVREALYGGPLPLIALSAERLATASTCVQAANDCTEVATCLDSVLPDTSGC